MKKNEKGAALILVIIVMVVVSLLGAALLTTSLADAKHAIRQENVIQANYLARAAVDEIVSHVIEHEAFPSVPTSKTFSFGSVENIIMTKDSHDLYRVRASGLVNGLTSTVEATIARETPTSVFDYAIYTKADLNIQKMVRVDGDIASGGTVTVGNTVHNGDAYPGVTKNLAPVVVDSSFSVGTADLTVANNETFEMDAFNGLGPIHLYRVIDVKNGGTLLFDTGAAPHGNKVVVGVKEDFAVSYRMIVAGDGMLQVYVYNNMTIKGGTDDDGRVILDDTSVLEFFVDSGATLNIQTPIIMNGGNDPNRLRIYLAAGATLNLSANGNAYFYVYGPDATINLQSSQTTIYGAIIGNVLTGTGNEAMGSVIFQAPDSSWSLQEALLSLRFYRNP